jgi:hypothetical protein
VIDLLDRYPVVSRSDSPGETSTEGDPHALTNLLLDPARRGSHQELTGRVQQQHGSGIDRHQVANLVEQLLQQLVNSEPGQSGVGHDLQPSQPFLRRAQGLYLR